MKAIRTHKQMIVCFLPGFVLGILYMNLIFQKDGGMNRFYITDFLNRYYHSNTRRAEYFIYILRVRVLSFGVVTGLVFTRLKKLAAYMIMVWTGFLLGILMSVSVISMGIKGCAFCIAGFVPQIFFYLAAYIVLLGYAMATPYSRWDKLKTEFVIGSVVLGVLSEVYINPFVLKLWIKL